MKDVEFLNRLGKIKKDADLVSSECEEYLKNPYGIRGIRLQELMYTIKRLSFKLYLNSDKVSELRQLINSHLYDLDYLKDEIQVFGVNDDYIYFRIPMLSVKREKINFSGTAIHYVFRAIYEEHGTIPQIASHYIVFTHVYSSACSEELIPGNDKYAITQVINRILRYVTPINEKADSWHIHRAIITDDVASGTYIAVIRRESDDAFEKLAKEL